MTRRARQASVGGAVLLVSYLLIGLVIPRFADVDALRPQLESRASALLGRGVRLERLRLSLWTGVEILADGVHVAGDPARGDDLEAATLAVRPWILSLFRGEIRPRSLTIHHGTLLAAGSPVLREIELQARLHEEGSGGERVTGDVRGRLEVLDPAGLPADASFDALFEPQRISWKSLSARFGPATFDAEGELTGLREGAPRLGLRGKASLGRTEASGTLECETRDGGPFVSFTASAPLFDFDEILERAREMRGPRRAASGIFPVSLADEVATPSPARGLLALVRAEGQVRAERGRLAGVELTDLSSRMVVERARLRFEDAAYTVHGGHGRATVEVAPADPAAPFHLEGSAEGVDLEGLLRESAPSLGGSVAGTASVTIDLTGEARASDRRHALSGKAVVTVRSGRVATRGDLEQVASTLRMAGARGIGADETRFDLASASFIVAGGIARTDDVAFRSADLDLDGGGTIDLAGPIRGQLLVAFSKDASSDFVGRVPQLSFRVGSDGRLTVPLTVRGTLSSPRVQLDLDRVLEEGLKRSLKDEGKKSLLRRILRKD